MSYLTAIILGLIQAATEFLPVSSSGHLVLYRLLTGETTEGHLLFDVMLHMGTLVAVLAVYGGDLLHVILAVLAVPGRRLRGQRWRAIWQRDPSLRLAAWMAVATVPAVVVGLLLSGPIERVGEYPIPVALFLLATGWVLFGAARMCRRERDLTLGRSVFIGLAQAAAILPGLSRSGLTISAGLAAGRSRTDAARFSFLLSVPAIVGAAVVMLLKSRGGDTPAESVGAGPVIVGTVVSAIVGYVALRILLKVLQRGRFGLFAYYCWAAGLAVILWAKVL